MRAGVPLNDFVSTVQSPNFGFNSTTNRYIIGPMAELRLPFGLGVEVNGLYRHFSFRGTTPSSTGTLFTSANSGAWEFPLLAKFRFPSKVIRPYVNGGVAWDTLTGLEQSVRSVVPVPPVIANTLVRHNTTSGFVLGAILSGAAGFIGIHLQPEVRYTRWGAQHFLDPNGGFSSNQNQAEFLLGITF